MQQSHEHGIRYSIIGVENLLNPLGEDDVVETADFLRQAEAIAATDSFDDTEEETGK